MIYNNNYPYNKKKITLTKGDPNDRKKIVLTKGDPMKNLYVRGNVTGQKGYSFKSMVFESGSPLCFNNGRLFKFSIYQNEREVMKYYDGYETWNGPKHMREEHKKVLSAIDAAFPEPSMLRLIMKDIKTRFDENKSNNIDKAQKQTKEDRSKISKSRQTDSCDLPSLGGETKEKKAAEKTKLPLTERVSSLRSSKSREDGNERGR